MKNKKSKIKFSDLASKWKMTNKEAKIFMDDLRKGWKKWKIKQI